MALHCLADIITTPIPLRSVQANKEKDRCDNVVDLSIEYRLVDAHPFAHCTFSTR
jgi:hypothetical protein